MTNFHLFPVPLVCDVFCLVIEIIIFRTLSLILLFCALSYNPFIYCWLNSTFRTGAKKFFSYLIKCDVHPVVHISEDRRRSSLQDNETKLDTMVTTATNLNTCANNSKMCSALSLQESPETLCANNTCGNSRPLDAEQDV